MSLKAVDSKILSVANNIAGQGLKESQKSFSKKIQRFQEERYEKGMWNSSITGNRILELFEEEFKKRTLIIWEAYEDCLRSAQIILTENMASEIKQCISNLLNETSLDVISIFRQASRPISMANASKSIDEIKSYALSFSSNKIDLVVLESYVAPSNTTTHQKNDKNKETLDLGFRTLPTQQKRISQSNKVQNLRNSITKTQEKIINKIADFYLDNHKWIPEVTLCIEFRLNTKEINEQLNALGGMVVWIDHNDHNQICYVLGFPGILLSKIGNQIEELFIHYLEFLRSRLVLNNEMKSIKLDEVVQSLKLGDYEKFILRLCFKLAWNPFGGLGGSMVEPSIGIPRSYINLVLTKDIQSYFYTELDNLLDLEMPLESNKHYFYTRKIFRKNKLQEPVVELKKDKKIMIRVKAEEVKGTIDFGMITIRDDEHRAVLARFPKAGIIDGNRQYMLSEIDIADSDDKYKVAIVRLPEMGETEALNATRDMIEDLDPSWIVLVGIAGGVPSTDFTLGDVLIATRLVDFCVEEVSLSGSRYDSYGGAMHPIIRNYVSNLAAREDEIIGWNSLERINYPQPVIDISDGKYYEEQGIDEKWKAKVKKTLVKHFGNQPSERTPKFMIATTASSDRLIKDPRILQVWQTTGRKILLVEMELAGVYKGARRLDKEYPILAVRGISDIVGFERDDNWTEYACNTAASLAYFLLKYTRPIEPKLRTEIDPQ